MMETIQHIVDTTEGMPEAIDKMIELAAILKKEYAALSYVEKNAYDALSGVVNTFKFIKATHRKG